MGTRYFHSQHVHLSSYCFADSSVLSLPSSLPPPADEAPAPDVESLLLASLSSLPREATINVITGFQELTAGLTRYLKKASEEGGAGKVIGRREVEEFFEKWKAGER